MLKKFSFLLPVLTCLWLTPVSADTYIFQPGSSAIFQAVPPQWNEANNTVLCIGAGGGGSSGVSGTRGGSGGGSGSSDQSSNVSMEGVFFAQSGTGGTGGSSGGAGNSGSPNETSLYSASGGTKFCDGQAGSGGNGSTLGAGGPNSLAAGSVHFVGGSGGLGASDSPGSGTCTTPPCGAGGGAGGAGPNAAGTNGGAYSGATGGNGGQGDGTFGGGGGAGVGSGAGNNGTAGTEVGGLYGSGGGGGGGGEGGGNNIGGNGALCGAGGGGAGDNTHTAGSGGNGCQILNYQPITSTVMGDQTGSTSRSDTHDQIACYPWTAPITGVGNTLFWSLNSSLTASFVAGIYDSDNTVTGLGPGTPLVQIAAVSNPGSGLSSAALTSQFSATRGHVYWFCENHNTSSLVNWNSASGTSQQEMAFTSTYNATMPSIKNSTLTLALASQVIIYIPLMAPSTGAPNPFLGSWGL